MKPHFPQVIHGLAAGRGMASRCVVVLFVVALLCPPVLAAALSREQVLDLYTQGRDHFRAGIEMADSDPEKAHERFLQSAMAFETIVRDGRVRNGKLFYNIGNAYFRSGDIGRAILNYRRALQLTPNDPNLQQNLAYVRAQRVDKIPEPEVRQVLRILFFWHYDFSQRVRSLVFFTAFVVFWLALGIALFWRRAWPAWAAGAAACVALFMLGSLAVEYRQERVRQPGVVMADAVVARKGDSSHYEQAFASPLHAGTEFVVLELRDNWLEVELADGRTCWLPRAEVALVR